MSAFMTFSYSSLHCQLNIAQDRESDLSLAFAVLLNQQC